MEAHVNYLSSAVNQVPRNFDWGPNGIICYAASTGVLLYDPKIGAVIGASSKVHTSNVTSVRWVHPTPSTGTALISMGSDSKTVVWTVSEEKIEGLHVLHPSVVLDHEDAVPLADATVVTEDGKQKILLITVTVDILTSFLVCPVSGQFTLLNAFAPPARAYVMSLRLFEVEGAKYPGLICGGHDSRIHILTATELGHYYPVTVLNGHEDWVTTLDIMKEDNGCLLLASGSKDASVRLWRFSAIKSNEQLQDTLNAGRKELRLRSVIFKVPSDTTDITLSVLLDAILAGHEGLVSEVYWAQPVIKDNRRHQPYKLLTCSKTQDRSIIIWEPEGGSSSGSGLWLERARLGEVGGNMEGYYSCQFNPDATQVLGCSYQGGLHLWEYEVGTWQPCVVTGGHFDQVVDVSWDPHGRYLLSASKDQTTRLHAPWKKTNGEVVWHEVGRPQVHGYNMACIYSLGKYSFASGAEEKVIRGFTAPANFIRNFGQICGIDVEEDVAKCEVGEGASVPSLGLSNKAVMIEDLEEEKQIQEEGKEEVQAYFRPLTLFAPATEDQLMQNTLWPEAAKLYGHGNDIIALAASSDGTILASSCRAAHNIDAQIILWDTKTWHKIDVLFKHRLTVTQMAFSSDDQYLLSVSRDRSWTVFKREAVEDGAGFKYKVSDFSCKKDTAHSRVIWSCAWMPDSHLFVTASRDKTVALWDRNDTEWVRQTSLKESDEVTAVAVTRSINKKTNSFLLATGLVNGEVHLRQYYPNEATFSEILEIFHKHQDSVRRLQFKPASEESNDYAILASCADDRRVLLFQIKTS